MVIINPAYYSIIVRKLLAPDLIILKKTIKDMS